MTTNTNKGKSYCTFNEVLERARERVDKLSESKRAKIKDDLDHGAAILDNEEQLSVYMDAYGEIHQAKLEIAFAKLPTKIFKEPALSVVDYGCGQGIATMVLSDCLSAQGYDIDKIREIVMIEPSTECLKQAVSNVAKFLPEAKIGYLNEKADDLRKWQISPTSDTVIHLFSNVIDIPDFPRDLIAEKLDRDGSHNNIVICVSPYYQDNGRGKYMDEFGDRLKTFRCIYSFEKHTDEWEKDFSCQIRIYVNNFY